MSANRTLVLCKPDAVERQLVGEIVGRLERRGLRIVAMELRQIDDELAGQHYDEHREQAVLRRPGGVHHPQPARGDGGRGSRRHVADRPRR